MASWRDTASEQTQRDLDELLDDSLQAAQSLLAENGEFIPFGLGISPDGELRAYGVDESVLPAEPTSHDVADSLVRGFSAGRDEIRAAAVVADVRVKASGEDAIDVALEHSEGPAMNVLLPYTKAADSAEDVEYGDLSAAPAEKRVWAD